MSIRIREANQRMPVRFSLNYGIIFLFKYEMNDEHHLFLFNHRGRKNIAMQK